MTTQALPSSLSTILVQTFPNEKLDTKLVQACWDACDHNVSAFLELFDKCLKIRSDYTRRKADMRTQETQQQLQRQQMRNAQQFQEQITKYQAMTLQRAMELQCEYEEHRTRIRCKIDEDYRNHYNIVQQLSRDFMVNRHNAILDTSRRIVDGILQRNPNQGHDNLLDNLCPIPFDSPELPELFDLPPDIPGTTDVTESSGATVSNIQTMQESPKMADSSNDTKRIVSTAKPKKKRART